MILQLVFFLSVLSLKGGFDGHDRKWNGKKFCNIFETLIVFEVVRKEAKTC